VTLLCLEPIAFANSTCVIPKDLRIESIRSFTGTSFDITHPDIFVEQDNALRYSRFMDHPPRKQKRIKSDFNGRTPEERQLIAEQQFLRIRKISYVNLARALGVATNTVKSVALGIHRNERVMAALLEEWRRIKAETADYEFWREG